jgi:hypothetical protein
MGPWIASAATSAPMNSLQRNCCCSATSDEAGITLVRTWSREVRVCCIVSAVQGYGGDAAVHRAAAERRMQ